MLRIKLSRVGKKKAPMYRILVMEKSKDPWGNFLENVGTYNPHTDPSTIEFKKERVEYWISKGAQPTDSVHNLLVTAGIISDKKRSVSTINKKRQAKMDEAAKAKEEAEAKPAPEAEAAPEGEAPADAPATEEAKAETPAEEKAPEAEAPKEEPKAEEPAKEEAPTEEAKPEEPAKEEAPTEEAKPEEKPAE